MLSDICIKRPIGTALLALALAVAGIVAFNLLPVAPLPHMDFPTIKVQASLPGASPEIMASSVATPLEKQLGHISGVTEITSMSTLGQTNIVLQFDLSRNIDGAARDVQAAINNARTYLPINLPNNPTYRKVNPADAPILVLALTSHYNSRGQLYDLASTILAQKLSQIDGVGEVMVGGSSLPAIRIEANPYQLDNAGISLNAIGQLIKNENINIAKGQLMIDGSQSHLSSNDQLVNAAQYRQLIVEYKNGQALRLSDVATVENSVENIRAAGFSNGKPAVVLIIFKEPGANVIQTVDNIYHIFPELKALLPGTVHLSTVADRTTTIRASLHDIEFTLVIATILVILVVLIFLGSMQSMVIPGIAVVLSLLGTFAVMRFFDFTLDNLSLMALTISTGFVIDDAIVVLENISRHVEAGMTAISASIQGAREVSFTVIAMSISLIAVFTPLIFMGGIVGRLFREFGLTLSIAILVSLITSLTVTPMLCAYFLTPHKDTRVKCMNNIQQLFVRGHHYYAKTLAWALRHQRMMLYITLAAIVVNIALFLVISKGFFPEQDTGRIIGSVIGDQNISFNAMKKKLVQLITLVQHNPTVANVAGFTGNDATNQGKIYISLVPQSQRKLSANAIVDDLRDKLKNVKGATLYLQPAQDLIIGGHATNAQYQYNLFSTSLNVVDRWAPRILETMKKIPGLTDVNNDQQSNGLQLFVKVNHDRALQLGITSQTIDQELYSAFGQNQVSTLYLPLNQYHVVLEAAPSFWQDPKTLSVIRIPSSSGQMVPLSEIAQVEPRSSLLVVNHVGLFPSATLSFNLLPGVALGDAVTRINKAVAEMNLPANIHTAFSGTAEAFQASLKNEPYLILAALLAVYIVLGILYESWIHPITILSTLPSAGIGALLALIITHTDLTLIAFIGIILLIGIVKKNAIMMIDVAMTLQREKNYPAEKAIYEACLLRFRPIMMTTIAAMLGALPLAIGIGVGAELRQPLGIAIIGGLLVSQLLTIYTTPVVYLYFDKKFHAVIDRKS